jgi:hypothetical protein
VEQATKACRNTTADLGWQLIEGQNEQLPESSSCAEEKNAELGCKAISFEHRRLSQADWKQTLKTPQGHKAQLFAVAMGPRGVKLVLLWSEKLSRSTAVNFSNKFFNAVEAALTSTAN